MNARARLVEVAYQRGNRFDIAVGTTIAKDAVCADQLEAAIALMLGLQVSQIECFGHNRYPGGSRSPPGRV